jgi:hypothetical protein
MTGTDRKRLQGLVDSGEYQKALSLCMGFVSGYWYDEELYRWAGVLWLKAGDPARAGLYWLLTRDLGDDAEKCVRAAALKYGRDLHRSLRLYVRPRFLPRSVRRRAEQVLAEVGAGSLEENRRIRHGVPRGSWRAQVHDCCGLLTCAVLLSAGASVVAWLVLSVLAK